jgi:diguanylate cyclase (GGDEF)-like protein/PAS domain S-box-containing protein/putative nucleotidyltransferase with HDIG domain
MKVKTKILLSILPMFFIGIIVTNIAFWIFFQNFVQSTELDRIRSSASFVNVFLEEKLQSLQNTVNDWAHWDDTFYFMDDMNTGYISSNLNESSFSAIDINFMLFVNSEGIISYALNYDSSTDQITSLTSDLSEHIQPVLNFSKLSEDTSGILKIGDNYYFIASSVITDSLENDVSDNLLIIGRKFDEQVITQIEKNSSINVKNLSSVSMNEIDLDLDSIDIQYDSNNHSLVNVELNVLNKLDPDTSIMISMSMPRDLYVKAMDQVIEFSKANTLYSLVSLIVVFLLLSRFVKYPFANLLKDVQSIDLTKSSFEMISNDGSDEFAFLRKAINTLMNRIMKGQVELADSRNELQTTLISIGEGIITVDSDGLITFMNPAANNLTGWSSIEALGKKIEDVLVIVNEEELRPLENPVYQVFETKVIVRVANNAKLRSKTNDIYPVEITAAPIMKSDGAVHGCVLALSDVSESRAKQKQIEYLSYQDILTGAYNRVYYEKKMNELEADKDADLSLMIIDVNGLKLTNDAFGHQVGDRLLIKVVESIKQSIRAEDLVFRIGGDEFVVILANAKSSEVEHVFTRFLRAIESEKMMNIPISVSIGWGIKQSSDEKMETVFKNAEDMMYRHKASDNKSLRHQTIQLIMKTLFEKNPREEAHSKRVSNICLRIGEKMGLDASRLKDLHTAGLLHDIGKISVENNYLDKAGPLNEEEWNAIRKHPQIGHSILSSVNDYAPLADIVLSHHERWDGKGYPNGLSKEEIPLEARVIAVADAYDAMTSDRSYRKALELAEVVEEFKRCAGTQFDPEVVKLFLQEVLNDLNLCDDCQ